MKDVFPVLVTGPTDWLAKRYLRQRNGVSIADHHDTRCLRVRNCDAREGSSDVVEQGIDTAAKRCRANSDSEGDEDDEHGVFGRCGTALVNTDAIEKTDHLKFLLQVRSGPMANKRQSRSATACGA